jgi:hypothetical protein
MLMHGVWERVESELFRAVGSSSVLLPASLPGAPVLTRGQQGLTPCLAGSSFPGCALSVWGLASLYLERIPSSSSLYRASAALEARPEKLLSYESVNGYMHE